MIHFNPGTRITIERCHVPNDTYQWLLAQVGIPEDSQFVNRVHLHTKSQTYLRFCNLMQIARSFRKNIFASQNFVMPDVAARLDVLELEAWKELYRGTSDAKMKRYYWYRFMRSLLVTRRIEFPK